MTHDRNELAPERHMTWASTSHEGATKVNRRVTDQFYFLIVSDRLNAIETD